MFWAMQVMGGEPEIAFLSGIIIVIFFAGLIIGRRIELPPGHVLKRTAVVLSASAALALCLSCVQWLLTLELSGLSNRAGGLSFDEAVKWSLEPGTLLTLLAPNYIMDPGQSRWWALGFQTKELPYLLSVYPGIVALVLVVFSVRKTDRASLVFLGGAFLFLLLSLGEYGGLYW